MLDRKSLLVAGSPRVTSARLSVHTSERLGGGRIEWLAATGLYSSAVDVGPRFMAALLYDAGKSECLT